MTVGELAALSVIVGLVAAGSRTAFGGQDIARPGVHLSWVRESSAAECPDASIVEEEVAARLADNPFRRAPTQFVEAVVARQAAAFVVTIAMRDRRGHLIANRSLSSVSEDCGSISTAAALIIAILIDPDILTHAPPPPLAAAPRPAALGFGARLAIHVEGASGTLPALAVGLAFEGTVDVARRLAVGLTTASFPEVRARAPNDSVAFGQSSAGLAGCFVATDLPASRARWELCGGISVGLMHIVVSAAMPTNPGQRWNIAAAQMSRLVVPLGGHAILELTAGLEEPFTRRSFVVDGAPAATGTVFQQPALAATGSVGFGLGWR